MKQVDSTEEILRLASQKAKSAILQGERSEQSFERLDKVMKEIGEDLRNNPEFLEAVEKLERQ